jgi:hypothetical protein
MPLIREVTSCSTSIVQGLDQQLITEINAISPNSLVSIADLNVQASGSAVWLLLQPAAKTALAQAINQRGTTMLVNSAYRTIAQQLILYQHFRASGRCGIVLAARPGRSNHQSGLALDIEDHNGWQSFLSQNNWRWLGASDPVHFDYIGGNVRDIRGLAILAFQRLWNRNHPGDRLAEDSIYGSETEKRLGMTPVDGFVNGDRIEFNNPQIDTHNFPRLLLLKRPILEGEDVKKVQQALVAKGFTLAIDGFFGPNTQKAVKEFQAREGLSPDGIVGSATLTELGLISRGISPALK